MSLFDWLRPEPPRRRRRNRKTERAVGHSRTRGGAEDRFAQLHERLARTLDGRYLVRDILGAGGMGVVFLADDLALDRAVAIKVLPPEISGDATVVSRFRKEAKTAARLDHPGIIPIYRVENEGGLDYFIMKYVAGRSLETVLREETTLEVSTARRILREASAALAHAHRHGVVHRDVKPANIMLDADDRVVLTDFGISKASSAAADDETTEPRLTELGTAIGTPQYMAPEQAVGQAVDGRADQYALAIVGFEMLAGYVPFDDETPHAIIHRQISEAPPDLASVRPDAPRHVAATIAKGLRKSPSSRFATMEEFATALDDTSMSTASPTGTRPVAGVGATRVLAGDDRELDSALDRVFDPSTGSSSTGLRRFTWAMTMIALVFGFATVAWNRGVLKVPGLTPKRSTAARTAPKSTVKQAGTPKPTTARTTRTKEPARRTTTLSVTSVPRATLFIDGKRVGETPVTNRPLTVGRTYRIRVDKKGYRTKSETITATTRALRRSYVLERVARR